MTENLNQKPKTQNSKLKIFVTGTRGIPDIPGGVEKHCQDLYPLIVAQGHEVLLSVRSSYAEGERPGQWRGVRLAYIFAPRKKSLEAIVHTFLSVLKARLYSPDIMHIHGIGPGLMVPLARLLGLRVVVTNHGPDYDREKWGKVARSMLRLGEWAGGRFANQVITISTIIQGTIAERCGRDSTLIYNGVTVPEKASSTSFLDAHGLRRQQYVLAVARLVPEKGLHLLLDAFNAMDTKGYKLVIAGDADHETAYSRELKNRIKMSDNVVHAGYITGEPLNQIYSHAGLFVLPSFIEGLPIALLEAMSYGLPVLVSDIPANREVALPAERYFKCGDEGDLRDKLEHLLDKQLSESERAAFQQQIVEKYNWEKIATQTVGVYEEVVRG